MWKVPLSDLTVDEKEYEAVQQVMRSGWLTMGEKTACFEEIFAKFLGVKHAIAVSNGTAALHLANLVLGIGTGDEVICPSLTFVASANAIMYTGARPIFAEIVDANNLNISPQDIETKITEQTKAIEVVHYAGYPCDMQAITEIAQKYGLYIIEDCAHAPGAEYQGEMCGTLGDIGCFSFFPNKNMTTAEGGMVTTANSELADKLRFLRSHGMTTLTSDRHKGHAFSYDVVELGYNYRLDEIRSAMGIAQLKKLPQNNAKRRLLIQYYKARLVDVEEIQIPFEDCHDMPSYHIFPILLRKDIDRRQFMQYLKQEGIQTSIHYPPIHLFDFYRREFGYQKKLLPVTEDVALQEVTLPLYPAMDEDTITYICDHVVKFFQKRRNNS